MRLSEMLFVSPLDSGETTGVVAVTTILIAFFIPAVLSTFGMFPPYQFRVCFSDLLIELGHMFGIQLEFLNQNKILKYET
jgi:hypothetical protein